MGENWGHPAKWERLPRRNDLSAESGRTQGKKRDEEIGRALKTRKNGREAEKPRTWKKRSASLKTGRSLVRLGKEGRQL